MNSQKNVCPGRSNDQPDFVDTGNHAVSKRSGYALVAAARHEPLCLDALAKTRGFALQPAQIVQFGAPNSACTNDIDMIDHRSV